MRPRTRVGRCAVSVAGGVTGATGAFATGGVGAIFGAGGGGGGGGAATTGSGSRSRGGSACRRRRNRRLRCERWEVLAPVAEHLGRRRQAVVAFRRELGRRLGGHFLLDLAAADQVRRRPPLGHGLVRRGAGFVDHALRDDTLFADRHLRSRTLAVVLLRVLDLVVADRGLGRDLSFSLFLE